MKPGALAVLLPPESPGPYDVYEGHQLKPSPIHGDRSAAMTDRLQMHEDAYHEGTEERGIISLIAIILGLIGVGVLMYSLTWALAPH